MGFQREDRGEATLPHIVCFWKIWGAISGEKWCKKSPLSRISGSAYRMRWSREGRIWKKGNEGDPKINSTDQSRGSRPFSHDVHTGINSSNPLLMEFQPLFHNSGSKPLFMKSKTPNVCINSSKPLFKEFQTPFHGIPNPYFRGCVCIQIQVKHTNLKYHLGNNPRTPLGKRYGSRKTSQRLWDRTSEQSSEDTFAVLN